jgi:hypothetical protein
MKFNLKKLVIGIYSSLVAASTTTNEEPSEKKES